MQADILQVRTGLVNFYVLRDANGLYLLDGGFIGGRWFLRRALRRHGWEHLPIRGIILSHGHLDHILNVAAIARQSGAWVAAPKLDADHYAGRPRYRGWAGFTGLLEGIGRLLLRYKPFVPDRWLEDGDMIDVWHGLWAVHLPGHTAGHMGFYCQPLKLLFCGDLFASYRWFSHFPPSILNSEPARLPGGVAAALSLDLGGILPNHGGRASPEEHLRRLRKLAGKAG